MEIIKSISELNRELWENFIWQHPNGNIFQSPGMFEFYAQLNHYEPVVVAVKEDKKINGILVGVIQKEKSGLIGNLSARTIISGGPLIVAGREDEIKIMDLLLKELIRQVKDKCIYIQFRNFFSQQQYRDVYTKHGFRYHSHLNFIVNTEDKEKVQKKLSKSKRRQIKKAKLKGATVIEAQHLEQVRSFYEILSDLYKNKVKKPLPDWSYFKLFYEMGQQQGRLGKYLLVQYAGEIIGGMMCPITPGRTIFEWYVAGKDKVFKEQYPGVLATWAAMDYALDNHLSSFDFMGAGTPDEDYGVREFKSKFGGGLVNYGRYERINNHFLYKLGKFGLKVKGILGI